MMTKFFKLGFLVVLAVLAKTTQAQYYFYDNKYYENSLVFEVGVSGGIMNCFTDIGGKKGLGKGFIKDLNTKNSQFAGGIYATALYKSVIGLRLEATFGQVKAYDSILKGDQSEAKKRYNRNLNFKSAINEFSAMIELHPIFFKNWDNGEPPRLSPYLLGGISLFSFNPQGNLNGRWVNLEPLRTEGQGFTEYPKSKRYKLSQMNIPIGFGFKYELSSLINARIELVHRILFTDHLDDVSGTYIDPTLFGNYLTPSQAALAQAMSNRALDPDPKFSGPDAIRGDVKDNDAYFSINFKIGINLGRNKIR
jgi:Domain of unknown function (DUF6089)